MAACDAEGQPALLLTDPFDAHQETWGLQRLQRGGIWMPRVCLASAAALKAFLARAEAGLRAIDPLESALPASASDEPVAAIISYATIGAEPSPVIKLVNSTLHDALKMRASDIHLECDAGVLRIIYRIDGALVPITQLDGSSLAEEVVSRIKVMAELDIAERRVPQDGRFRVRIDRREVDFRVSVMPNLFGEDAVLRLLDRQSVTDAAEALRLDRLGFDPDSLAAIRRIAKLPHGMLLVTGPTGSGKTTTLYAAISEIHTGRDKIVTIEDPIEYRLPRVLQIPVNEKKGLSFARGLRSILRHDPDKIMVGEIRDDETAAIAVQAALTGHLVLTTVHANNVIDVLGRFLHMGIDAHSLAASLNGIVSQRLLRRVCPHCAQPHVPSDDELLDAGLTRSLVAGWTLRVGRGCIACRGTGYLGRQAIAEVLQVSDPMRELISARASSGQMRALARSDGFKPLTDSAWISVAAGDTTMEEVARVAA